MYRGKIWGVQMTRKKKVNEYWKHPVYKGFKLADVVHRPGALDILEAPSRVNNTYYYPDGRVIRHEQVLHGVSAVT